MSGVIYANWQNILIVTRYRVSESFPRQGTSIIFEHP